MTGVRQRGRGRHADRGAARRPALLAGLLTAAVAVGAAVAVAGVRGPEPAADRPDASGPVAADRSVPTSSRSAAPPSTPRASRSAVAAPVPAGGLRPAPEPTARRAPTTPPTSQPTTPPTTPPATASRERRTPVPPATPAAGPGRAGSATFYTLAGLPNCGFPDAAGTGRYAAVSPGDYAAAAACGTVLDVTGPKGTVRVTVSDLCPECAPGQLDLAAPAFAAIADPVQGIVPVRYARVADPPLPGGIRVRVKEGSSAYWLAVLLLDTGNPVTAVEVRSGAGWRRLAREPYNYWIAPSGAGPGPYDLRVTDDRGGQRVLPGVRLSPGTVQATGLRTY